MIKITTLFNKAKPSTRENDFLWGRGVGWGLAGGATVGASPHLWMEEIPRTIYIPHNFQQTRIATGLVSGSGGLCLRSQLECLSFTNQNGEKIDDCLTSKFGPRKEKSFKSLKILSHCPICGPKLSGSEVGSYTRELSTDGQPTLSKPRQPSTSNIRKDKKNHQTQAANIQSSSVVLSRH